MPNPDLKYGSKYICADCRVAKAPEEFTVTKGDRGSICIDCNNKRRNAGKERRNQNLVESAIKHLVSHMKGTHIESPHISEVAAKLISQLGGLDSFIAQWATHFNAIMAEKPTSKMAHDEIRLIATLIRQSSELRDSAPDVATLTDDELAEEIGAYIETYGLKIHRPDEDEEVA